MSFLTKSIVVAAVTAAAAIVGCNDGTDFGNLNLDKQSGPNVDGGAVGLASEQSCGQPAAPPIEKLDPASFPPCAPACAGARCVPAAKVPEVSRSSFATCGGGYCIPESLIRSGAAKPPSCKSLNNAEGVCLSVCVPQVAEHVDALPQQGCAGDERCAPCINPNTNQPTGACAIGTPPPSSTPCAPGAATTGNPSGDGGAGPALACPHNGPPVLDPMTLPACGNAGSAAHCVAPSLVTPPEMKARLRQCSSGGYCVPDTLIASGGRYIPKSCTSTAGAEGRCQNVVLPEVEAQASNLPIAGCNPSERCVPCFNPVDGLDTGACHTSCDPGPIMPPVRFPSCCGGQGKCVPSSSVPASTRSSLKTDTCSGGALCAPTENIVPGFVPQQCSAWTFFAGDYTGVCVSNCADFGSNGFALDQGNCDGAHTCAPCRDQNGQPTNAPGCS